MFLICLLSSSDHVDLLLYYKGLYISLTSTCEIVLVPASTQRTVKIDIHQSQRHYVSRLSFAQFFAMLSNAYV